MTEVTPLKGLHGTRQLVSAYAAMLLRRRGLLEPEAEKHGSGRIWTDDEFDNAQAMRLRGMSDKAIAGELGRTARAVMAKLGCERSVLTGRM